MNPLHVVILSIQNTSFLRLSYIVIVYLHIYISTFLFAVALSGEAIQARHCAVENSSGKVRLILAYARCYVNQDEVSDDTDLSHGTNIQCATLNFEDRL